MRIFAHSIGSLLLLCAATADAAKLYTANLTGDQESPAVVTNGSGAGSAIFDATANTLTVSLTFQDLGSPTADAHIHCCFNLPAQPNAGVAIGFPSAGFPLGVTSGAFGAVFDLTQASTFNGMFLANNGGTAASATAALVAGLDAGKAYFNIHTTVNRPGEIRGNLTFVPEPATLLLAGLAAPLWWLRRR